MAALALLLLVGSVGALGFRPWGRVALLLWACASVGLAALGCFFYFRWILPPWRDGLAQVRGVVDSLVNLGGWAIGGCLSIAMLIFLTRRSVRAAFATRGERATV